MTNHTLPCVALRGRFKKPYNHDKVRQLIHTIGARFTSDLEKATHVVTTEICLKSGGRFIEDAKDRDLKILGIEWLEKCSESQCFVDANPYTFHDACKDLAQLDQRGSHANFGRIFEDILTMCDPKVTEMVTKRHSEFWALLTTPSRESPQLALEKMITSLCKPLKDNAEAVNAIRRQEGCESFMALIDSIGDTGYLASQVELLMIVYRAVVLDHHEEVSLWDSAQVEEEYS
ncbi:hypothetical protein BDP55DRAFT_639352 [Colletotrichum godetiae]|uniref:BRCT domain-containing protein n=1 Tax=Colletotrichum godetiae TaxID=1209918 RepID=A0AAJ0A5A4_9PEZI|nr:uncharacterized protein BDP55DRAFT_639352 [Colletotrichum godetiae]KAK1656743.1 hypothetical protein BDP55DRAFT_639352 [Colletotrichum godetiae]